MRYFLCVFTRRDVCVCVFLCLCMWLYPLLFTDWVPSLSLSLSLSLPVTISLSLSFSLSDTNQADFVKDLLRQFGNNTYVQLGRNGCNWNSLKPPIYIKSCGGIVLQYNKEDQQVRLSIITSVCVRLVLLLTVHIKHLNIQ